MTDLERDTLILKILGIQAKTARALRPGAWCPTALMDEIDAEIAAAIELAGVKTDGSPTPEPTDAGPDHDAGIFTGEPAETH